MNSPVPPPTPPLSESYLNRFGGTLRLYGRTAAQQLQQSHLVIIGIGGVGSWCVEAAARTGIGTLTLIDPDDIALSNTNRQLHTLHSTLEQSKVAVMAERVAAINPECRLTALDDRLAPTNLARLIPADALILDCIDQVAVKVALIAYAVAQQQPIITTGGAGGRIDPCSVRVDDLSRTYNDPLASRVRSQLRRQHQFSRDPKQKFRVPCIFSSEQPRYPTAEGEVSLCKPPQIAGTTLDCRLGYGAVSMVTATFGMVAVAEAVKRLLHASSPIAS